MAKFDLNDSSVVVIVGSGAGGGTLGNELAQKGVKVVILEAGPRIENQDFINDEWDSFTQLAWTDTRTTSGNWRVAKDFSESARLDRQGGRRLDHRTGPAPRCASTSTSSRSRAPTATFPGANLLDWPITLAEMEPWYAKAENKMGVTRTNGIPGLPGNNNFRVLEAGAKKLGYKTVHTGNMAINSRAARRTRLLPADRLLLPGLQIRREMVDALHRDPQGRGHRQSRGPSRQHGDQDRARCERQGHRRGLCRRDRRNAAPEGADRRGRRQFDREPAPAAQQRVQHVPRRPRQLDRGQVGRNYMRHMTGSVYAVFEKSVHMYRGTTMAGIIRDEAANNPKRGFVGGYEMETLSLGLPFMAAFLNPGCMGPAVHRGDGRLSADGRHVAGRRGHAAGDQPHHARSNREGQVRPCRWRACITTIIPTTSRCGPTPTSRAPRSMRRSAPP